MEKARRLAFQAESALGRAVATYCSVHAAAVGVEPRGSVLELVDWSAGHAAVWKELALAEELAEAHQAWGLAKFLRSVRESVGNWDPATFASAADQAAGRAAARDRAGELPLAQRSHHRTRFL